MKLNQNARKSRYWGVTIRKKISSGDPKEVEHVFSRPTQSNPLKRSSDSHRRRRAAKRTRRAQNRQAAIQRRSKRRFNRKGERK